MESVLCYLALGANIGNPVAQLELARAALQEHVGPVQSCSSFYETAPMTLPGDTLSQSNYVNIVLSCRTILTAAELLSTVQSIEEQLGLNRDRKTRWGAREIDIDILSYGSHCILAGRLTIPHPELHKRDFVLYPLREIAPDFIHPVTGLSIGTLIEQYESSSNPRTIISHSHSQGACP